VDSSLKVHKQLGPGLLESVYQICLTHELTKRGISVQCEVKLPIRYDGVLLNGGYTLYMVLENAVIVENKSVLAMHPVFHAQLLTYLKLTDLNLGFLINWNVPLIKHGIKRIVRGL
jgi:GxxExxY protein